MNLDGMAPYRAGVIGCGSIGSTIEDRWRAGSMRMGLPAGHASVYASFPRTQLIAGSDPNETRRLEFAERWAAPSKIICMQISSTCWIRKTRCGQRRHSNDVPRGNRIGVCGARYLGDFPGEADCELSYGRGSSRGRVPAGKCEADGQSRSARRRHLRQEGSRACRRGGDWGAPQYGRPLRRRADVDWVDALDLLNYFNADTPVQWITGDLEDGPELDPGGSAFLLYENGVRAFVNGSARDSMSFRVESLALPDA